VIIGIDNGLTGGLVAISKCTGTVVDKTVMPTLHRLKKREVDTRKVYEWIMDLESDFELAIEEPLHHARSSQAVRSMALSFGKLLGLAESRQWKVNCVSVHKWQKVMLGRTPKGKTKEVALAVANEIAPEECWLKSKRATKPHDGLIDAFLIARYMFKKTVGDS
tara:strand:- start:1658 stop:2149 length:492 start_codon:yes stop_codon:yes gene_type:complete